MPVESSDLPCCRCSSHLANWTAVVSSVRNAKVLGAPGGAQQRRGSARSVPLASRPKPVTPCSPFATVPKDEKRSQISWGLIDECRPEMKRRCG